jgi:hypothetical protein
MRPRKVHSGCQGGFFMTTHRHGKGKAFHQQQASAGGQEKVENVRKLNKEELGTNLKQEKNPQMGVSPESEGWRQGTPNRAPGEGQAMNKPLKHTTK